MMNVEYIARKICERRGVLPVKIESVVMPLSLAAGAGNVNLLAAVANTFYLVERVCYRDTDGTGNTALFFNINGASFEGVEGAEYANFECDSFQAQNFAAGAYTLIGIAWKITYA